MLVNKLRCNRIVLFHYERYPHFYIKIDELEIVTADRHIRSLCNQFKILRFNFIAPVNLSKIWIHCKTSRTEMKMNGADSDAVQQRIKSNDFDKSMLIFRCENSMRLTTYQVKWMGFFLFSHTVSCIRFHLFVYFLSIVCLLVFLFVHQYGVFFMLLPNFSFSTATTNCTLYMVFGEIVSFQCHFGLLLEMVNGCCVQNQLTRLVSNGQVICIVDLVLRMVYNNNSNILKPIWSMCECVCVWPVCQNSEHAMNIFIHASRIALALWLYQFEPLICACPTSIFITFQIQVVIYKRWAVGISDATPFSMSMQFVCSCVKWRVKWGKLFHH